jgi:hypothetical protein
VLPILYLKPHSYDFLSSATVVFASGFMINHGDQAVQVEKSFKVLNTFSTGAFIKTLLVKAILTVTVRFGYFLKLSATTTFLRSAQL